ncbi:MAG: Uma2 family endonuclease [Peptococcaceae bacterium]|nr:Uma2 family endonuclease [Peptococcaceae bacterium]MBQ3509278.1 Uma2 family endonuclease [Peptococcaceae bacterium]
MNAAEKLNVTLEEFMQMPKDEHQKYELIDGIVYMAPSPSREHQIIAYELTGQMYHVLKQLGCTAAGELDISWDGNVLRPDLVVFCNRDDEIPEIVFEILSPSTRHRDLGIKLVKYQQMGVKEYWIIDPKARTITVHDFVNEHAETYIIGETARSFIRPELEFEVTGIFGE